MIAFVEYHSPVTLPQTAPGCCPFCSSPAYEPPLCRICNTAGYPDQEPPLFRTRKWIARGRDHFEPVDDDSLLDDYSDVNRIEEMNVNT